MQHPFRVDQDTAEPFALRLMDANDLVLIEQLPVRWVKEDTLEQVNALPANVKNQAVLTRIALALNAFGDAPAEMIAAVVEQGGVAALGASFTNAHARADALAEALADTKALIVGLNDGLKGPSLMTPEARMKAVANAVDELGFQDQPEVKEAIVRANKAIAEFQEQPAEGGAA